MRSLAVIAVLGTTLSAALTPACTTPHRAAPRRAPPPVETHPLHERVESFEVAGPTWRSVEHFGELRTVELRVNPVAHAHANFERLWPEGSELALVLLTESSVPPQDRAPVPAPSHEPGRVSSSSPGGPSSPPSPTTTVLLMRKEANSTWSFFVEGPSVVGGRRNLLEETSRCGRCHEEADVDSVFRPPADIWSPTQENFAGGRRPGGTVSLRQPAPHLSSTAPSPNTPSIPH